MIEPSSSLSAWSAFFTAISTSAAALIGLMFVVITLINREEWKEQIRRNSDGLSTFSTPTVMHFCAALLVSAILVAPWRSLLGPAILLGATGLYGLVYAVRVMLRTQRLRTYTPDLEDWAWYNILPFVAYGAVFAGALTLTRAPAAGIEAFGAGALLLIFIGIRNAWDVVTYLAVHGPPGSEE